MIQPRPTVCENCGKPDERQYPKPLCLACFEAEVKDRQQELSFRVYVRQQMRANRLHEVQMERWLTGRWPIVAPR